MDREPPVLAVGKLPATSDSEMQTRVRTKVRHKMRHKIERRYPVRMERSSSAALPRAISS